MSSLRRHRQARDSRPRGEHSAAASGLRYTTDHRPGITRRRSGKDFHYFHQNGRRITDDRVLQRIRSLAIPPAWTDVWIAPDERSHLQATGRDDRGRKQYRYHPHWRATRDEAKYNRMIAFGQALPRLRQKIRREIRRGGLGREKVLAAVVRLLEISAVRVGNEEYASANGSYGLTTLQDRHATTRGAKVRLKFRGKAGKEHLVELEHARLAEIVKRCRDLPGADLFQYIGEQGKVRDVTSSDVNAYLREITGQDFTAKDFRTWTGTVLAAVALRELDQIDPNIRTKKKMVQAVEQVARQLGNTPSVCRKCYIHPVIFDSYLDGSLLAELQARAERTMKTSLGQLRAEEAAVVTLLQQKLKASRKQSLKSLLKKSIADARSGNSGKSSR